jgi:hypothetical protein
VCADPRVVVEGRLDEAFLEPVVRLCEELSTLRDVDATARLRIVPAHPGVIAEVSLKDGRVAIRRVSSPDNLRTTVEALLILPPAYPEPSVDERAPSSPAPPPGPAPSVNAPGLGFEVGLSLMARLSRAPTYTSLGPAAHASLRAGEWVAGLHLRWEPAQSLAGASPPGFEMETFGMGFSVGRRLVRASGFGLDLGVSGVLLNETQSVEGGADERSGTETDVRVGLVTRALVGQRPWLFSPSLELEISPARLRRDIQIDEALPPLPSWSVALGAGFVWGAL